MKITKEEKPLLFFSPSAKVKKARNSNGQLCT